MSTSITVGPFRVRPHIRNGEATEKYDVSSNLISQGVLTHYVPLDVPLRISKELILMNFPIR